jgi:drug/metabolite transporter (DMT)-like permease
MEQKKSFLGNALLLFTSMVWGFAFTAQKIAGEAFSTSFVVSIRFLLGALILIPSVYLLDRLFKNGRCLFGKKNPFFIDLTKDEFIGGILCGVVLLAATTLQQIGLIYASPGKASFLTALYVVFVPFFGLVRRKKASLNVWCSVAIALVGAYLLVAGDAGSLSLNIGDAVLILSAVVYALHITVIDIFAPKGDGVRISLVQFAVAGILCFPTIFVSTLPDTSTFLSALPSLLYLGLASTGFAYTAQVVGQGLSGTPTISSLIMSLESVFGLLGGVIFLGDRLTTYQIAGCVVIFLAVVFSQLPLHIWWERWKARKK